MKQRVSTFGVLIGALFATAVQADAPEPRFLRLCQRIAVPINYMGVDVANETVREAAQGTDDSAARKALLSLLGQEPAADLPEFARLMTILARTEIAELFIQERLLDVIPLLRRWARSIASDPGPVDSRTLAVVATGLVEFQAAEALPELQAMLRSANPQVHQSGAYILATLDVPEALPIQEQIARDATADPSLRCQVAASLIRAGNNAGRPVLLDTYRQYLRELKVQSSHAQPFGCRDHMETLHDPQLIAALDALGTEAEGVAKRNIETLTATMKLNGSTTEELKHLATENDWARAHETRYAAIHELTRRGGPEMIPFLEQLKPWVNPSGVEPVCGLVEGQKQIMHDDIVMPAIATLRLRAQREAARNSTGNAPPQ